MSIIERSNKIQMESEKSDFYSEENINWLMMSKKQLEDNRVIVKTMEELEDMENA